MLDQKTLGEPAARLRAWLIKFRLAFFFGILISLHLWPEARNPSHAIESTLVLCSSTVNFVELQFGVEKMFCNCKALRNQPPLP